MQTAHTRRYFLLTCPRTASNLIVRILNLEEQPDVALPAYHGGYYFLSASIKSGKVGAREAPISEWTEEQKATMKLAYQQCFDAFMNYTSVQANGKIAFVKEHTNMLFGPTSISKAIIPSQTSDEVPWLLKLPDGTPSTRSALNETLIPDEVLSTYYPVFVIRHPALMFPSLERILAKIPVVVFEHIIAERCAAMTYQFTRSMYNYYANLFASEPPHNGVHWPVIIDADDVMKHPSLVARVASLMDMDTAKTKFSWSKASEEDLSKISKIMQLMTSTLLASESIRQDLTSDGIDIDVEAKKWREEFGEDSGKDIERRVRDSMPDYEFLKSKRMLPELT